MIKAGLLSAILGLALAASLSSARYTDFSSELESSEIAKAKLYAESLLEVNEALKAKLPNDDHPEANMRVVKELLEGVNKVLYPAKKGALKMLVALEDADECDQKSYRTLAKNLVAADYLQGALGKSGTRVRAILNHYMLRHAQHCSTHHSQVYHTKVSQVSGESLRRVEAAFSDLKDRILIKDKRFHKPGTPRAKEFLQVYLRTVLGKPETTSASCKIVENIIEKVKQSPEDFNSVRPQVDPKSVKASLPKPTKIFEQYLFKPCAEYEKVLGDDLSAARLDAIAEEDTFEFMQDRKDLYKAMMQSRFCKLALKEKSQMTELYSEIWGWKLPRHL